MIRTDVRPRTATRRGGAARAARASSSSTRSPSCERPVLGVARPRFVSVRNVRDETVRTSWPGHAADRRCRRRRGRPPPGRAMLGREPLEQRVGVLGEANLERADPLGLPGPVEDDDPRARPTRRRSSRACRPARSARRTPPRAGGCSRRRGTASAQPRCRLASYSSTRGRDADVQRLDPALERDRDERRRTCGARAAAGPCPPRRTRARARRRGRPPTSSAARPRPRRRPRGRRS